MQTGWDSDGSGADEVSLLALLMYIELTLFRDSQHLYIEAGLWQRPMRKVPVYILFWETNGDRLRQPNQRYISDRELLYKTVI